MKREANNKRGLLNTRNKRLFNVAASMTPIGKALSLYIFSCFFDFAAIMPGFSISKLIGILFLIVVFLNFRVVRFKHKSIFLISILLVVSSFVAELLSSSVGLGFNTIITVLSNLLVLLFALSLPLSSGDRRAAAGCLLLGSVLMAVLMVFATNGVSSDATGRTVVSVLGYQQDANQFNGYLVPIVALMSFQLGKDYRKWYLVVGIVAVVYLAMFTGSRGGLIALLATAVAGLFVGYRHSHNRIFGVFCVLTLLIAAYYFAPYLLDILPSGISSRYVGDVVGVNTANLRMGTWKEIIDAYLASSAIEQLFGHGYRSVTLIATGGFVAHNSYLDLLYSVGLVGLFVWGSLIWSAVKNAKRAESYWLVISIIGFLALNLTVSDFASRVFWAVLMVSLLQLCAVREGAD